jgi:hypothetical protein
MMILLSLIGLVSRSTINGRCSLFHSIAMHRMSSWMHPYAVVPLPANGSRTRPCGAPTGQPVVSLPWAGGVRPVVCVLAEPSERARLLRSERGCLMRVVIDAVDRRQPITMEARIINEGAEDLPIVEYRHSGVADEDALPTLLCFAGGGASGAMFARLGEECALPRYPAGEFRYAGATHRRNCWERRRHRAR